ncbi:hypothetical protein H17ap60334_04932 [Thermosipho africanus H17ap60334]|uniref:hypothetical protein n=1 Tax=Thermosipho africanus TaxID=2421 RepID=UPI00028DA743|nr:hypothetical protein [Thermosipho africanus]EKF49528.1 hypothetical protein H17ap60334_04932 [Thermosipho africanus H17ap60334]
MKYEFLGNTKFVIVDGKAYPVKIAGNKKFVEIPDDVKINEKFLKPIEAKPNKQTEGSKTKGESKK